MEKKQNNTISWISLEYILKTLSYINVHIKLHSITLTLTPHIAFIKKRVNETCSYLKKGQKKEKHSMIFHICSL